MEEIVGFILFRIIFNTIGGTIRWIFGSIWRSIFNKPKYTFKEYLYGPEKSKDDFDVHHMFNNGIIGFIFLIILGSILV